MKCRAETTSDSCCWNLKKKRSYFLQDVWLVIIIICTRQMLRTTCFSSRWWGLFLFLFLPWLVEMTLGPPNRLIWTGGRGEYRWWRTEMRRERWATESDSKKGLIEAWGCWTEPWITNGCLHSLLPACRNESQPPPHQPGHSRLLARLSKKKGKKTHYQAREDETEGGREREREEGIMRRGGEGWGGWEADVCETRERGVGGFIRRSSHGMFFSSRHSGGWIVTPVRVRNNIRRHTAAGSPGGECVCVCVCVLVLLLCDAATCWLTHATTQLLSVCLSPCRERQQRHITPAACWSSHTHTGEHHTHTGEHHTQVSITPERVIHRL